MFEADLRGRPQGRGLPGAAASAHADRRIMPGGHISALLSSVPGSGEVMEGVVVVYSPAAKRSCSALAPFKARSVLVCATALT